ncbi:AgmX/PglI C-terminal domain-containing protein [Paraliomyxa miuraensis]|uniref:AgmX/PglI C-terminal domain-containing protein n=1 Tax=Paraliomyxa miuraensis TaxID=376150 RepID=UPI002259F632|nr:AgmX/PglI C-terminal domain-containing protein [Paraliomyxa miuraensis]MCX4244112.1 TonB family protein [Paraliomyxa miuraensis]
MNGRKATVVLTGMLATLGACKDDAAPDEAPAAEAAEGAGADAATPGGATPTVDPTPVPSEPPEPPPSGHAVAKVGSLLFISSTGEVGFELPPLGEGSRAAAGMTINVVGEQDGRLAIETLAAQPAEHHCAGTLDDLGDFRLRLFIGRDDLLPVLTESYTYEHEDGTKAQLSRGVPVPEGGDALLVRGTPLKLSVPQDRLGRFYEPGAALSSEGSISKLEPMEDDALTFAGAPLVESELFHQGRKLSLFGSSMREGGGALVTVRNPCLELVAIASRERMEATALAGGRPAGILGTVEPESGHFLASPYGGAFAVGGDDEDVWGGLIGTEVGEAYGVGGLGLVGTGRGGGSNPRYEVKAGTAIHWTDGSPAGQVVADHTFAEQPREEGGRTCFDVSIVGSKGPTLGLCFEPGEVGEREASSTAVFGLFGSGGPGSGGYGLGGGAGFGGRGKKVPRVRQAKADVTGSLDKDIIRRIVRAHINEVRYCYTMGLTKDPALAGKVEVSFIISPSGSVSSATVASSTLTDSTVDYCIAKAVKRWKFPKPTGGGVVAVKYPFVLEPG